MAMMISKFHKLIQSKVLWGAFAIIISISFVGLFTEMPKAKQIALSKVAPGKLEGTYVHPDEFYRAQNQTRLTYAINFGRWPSIPKEMEGMLRDEAWRRLVSVRTAEELGLASSEQEVVSAIQRESSFASQEGGFDPNMYRGFVNNVLYRGLGITEQQFEAHIQEQLSLSKVRNMVNQTLLASPEEVRRTYHTVTDQFTLEYTMIDAASVTNDVNVTEEYARNFFDERAESFTTSPMVKVKYTRFPHAEFAEQVEIAEEDAKAYYDDNIDLYTSFEPIAEEAEETGEAGEAAATEATTGDVAAAEEETEAEAAPEPTIKPFEEVRDEIVAEMTTRKAIILAATRATEFVVALQRDGESGKPNFDRIAAEFEREVELSPAIAETDTVDGIDAGTKFAEEAFERDLNPEDYFSDPVDGEEALYVLGLTEKIKPRIPAFEEVQDEVMVQARREAIREQLLTRADEVQKAVEAGLEAGRSFTEIVSGEGYLADQAEGVTALEGLQSAPNGEAIMRAVLSRNEGEFTDPLPVPNGVMIVRVASRRSSPTTALNDVQGQVVQNLLQERSGRAFSAFQHTLMDDMAFEDLQPVEDEVDETEEAPADAEAEEASA